VRATTQVQLNRSVPCAPARGAFSSGSAQVALAGVASPVANVRPRLASTTSSLRPRTGTDRQLRKPLCAGECIYLCASRADEFEKHHPPETKILKTRANCP